MTADLSFELHALTAQLDRAADRILRAEHGLPYRRFLALLMVGQLGTATQRQLAERTGVTEPSASRMTAVLAEAGLLEAGPDPGGGNRRRLALTPTGKDLVEQCRDLLEQRFATLVDRAGIPYAQYARHTRRLLETLGAGDDSRNTPSNRNTRSQR